MVSGNFTHAVGQIYTKKIKLAANKAVPLSASDRGIGGKRTIEVYIPDGSTCSAVYLGNSKVTTTDGIPVKKGDSRIMPISSAGYGSPVYGIASAAGDIVIAEYVE